MALDAEDFIVECFYRKCGG